MGTATLLSGYRDNPTLRASFHRLTELVFGFNLEDWYQRGYWDDRYTPYSFVIDDHVIANVSAGRMNLILNGHRRKAIQIGTVATHPEYRGQGYASELLSHVIRTYEKTSDLLFLYANEETFGFYEKFEFHRQPENRFTLDTSSFEPSSEHPTHLDMSIPANVERVQRAVRQRVPVSSVFGVADGTNILMFHCLYMFQDCVYSLDDGKILLLLRRKGKTLHLYDILSSHPVDFSKLAPKILEPGVKRIEFHFTPDRLHIETNVAPFNSGDGFFIRPETVAIKRPFRRPKTSEA